MLRLLVLRLLMRHRYGLTRYEIAQALEVHPRTVTRCIAMIDLVFPLKCRREERGSRKRWILRQP